MAPGICLDELGGIVKKIITAGVATLALVAGVLAAATPAGAALRVPKTTWPVCQSAADTYCVEGVSVTTPRGKVLPLTWVPSGTATPNATSDVVFSPIFTVNAKNIVTKNNWWVDQNLLALMTGTTRTFEDVSSWIDTPDFPALGAIYDEADQTYDINMLPEFWTSKVACEDDNTGQITNVTAAECYDGAILIKDNNQVKSIMWFTDGSMAQSWLNAAETSKFIDGSDLAKTKQQPKLNARYDATKKTFDSLEALQVPGWVVNSTIVNGATAAGVENQSPETGTAMAANVEAGRALTGRWTLANWQSAGLGAFGYTGLFVDAKAANEFVNHTLIDVVPTMQGDANKTTLAGQVGNSKYATNLDSDITIKVTVRTGEIIPGVTIAVGTDIVLDNQQAGSKSKLSVEGNPVTVPLAAKASDCTGENGVAKANVRQFQTLIFVQNDDNGFGVEGTSGDMYVGSNGVCSLSTPVWDAATKSFTWQVAAPHFAPDGTTQNLGFYKAVIPANDAKLLWGLDNPKDAVTALEIAITTEAGGSSAALKNISVKDGKIIIDVSGFGYSRPKLKISLKKSWKPATAMLNKSTITCVMGKTVKKITAVKPTCPKGYTKK